MTERRAAYPLVMSLEPENTAAQNRCLPFVRSRSARRVIPGALDPAALAALAGREPHKPTDRSPTTCGAPGPEVAASDHGSRR